MNSNPLTGWDADMPADKTESLARRSIGRLHDTVDDVVDDVKGRARDRLHRGAHAVHEVWDDTKGRARGAAGEARGYMRDHSLLTLGIGLGLGLLVSAMLRRPDAEIVVRREA
jgi:ElaB/YqjD/DUF883 family membrane-anchored ribosome-binding protein